jgi:hypothetical protein
MTGNEGIKNLQARLQQLYDIPLMQFTSANRQELKDLERRADVLGYRRAQNDTIRNIRYVPKGKQA